MTGFALFFSNPKSRNKAENKETEKEKVFCHPINEQRCCRPTFVKRKRTSAHLLEKIKEKRIF